MNTISSFRPIIDKKIYIYLYYIYIITVMTVFLKHVSYKKLKTNLKMATLTPKDSCLPSKFSISFYTILNTFEAH